MTRTAAAIRSLAATNGSASLRVLRIVGDAERDTIAGRGGEQFVEVETCRHRRGHGARDRWAAGPDSSCCDAASRSTSTAASHGWTRHVRRLGPSLLEAALEGRQRPADHGRAAARGRRPEPPVVAAACRLGPGRGRPLTTVATRSAAGPPAPSRRSTLIRVSAMGVESPGRSLTTSIASPSVALAASASAASISSSGRRTVSPSVRLGDEDDPSRPVGVGQHGAESCEQTVRFDREVRVVRCGGMREPPPEFGPLAATEFQWARPTGRWANGRRIGPTAMSLPHRGRRPSTIRPPRSRHRRDRARRRGRRCGRSAPSIARRRRSIGPMTSVGDGHADQFGEFEPVGGCRRRWVGRRQIDVGEWGERPSDAHGHRHLGQRRADAVDVASLGERMQLHPSVAGLGDQRRADRRRPCDVVAESDQPQTVGWPRQDRTQWGVATVPQFRVVDHGDREVSAEPGRRGRLGPLGL